MHSKSFTVLYCLLALPTYLLPMLSEYRGLTHSGALMESSALLIHFLCLLALIGLSWFRGLQTHQPWLIAFPFLAMAFDLLPELNWIFLLPTILHGVAIAAGGFIFATSFDSPENTVEN